MTSKPSRYHIFVRTQCTNFTFLLSVIRFHFNKLEEIHSGKQFKLEVIFRNSIDAVFKPMRVARDQQALPNQHFNAEYERHTSEIAAYHLDR